MSRAPLSAARTPLSHVRTIDALARHLDPTTRLAKVGSGYRSTGTAPSGVTAHGRFIPVGAGRLVATIPARLGDATHVGAIDDTGAESIWIDVVADDVRGRPESPSAIEAGALTYREAQPGSDLVHVVEAGRVEELRIVRAPADALATRHRIHASARVAELRVNQGAVEVVDDAGHVPLTSEPIVAYDAAGAPIPTTIAVRRDDADWLLDISVDTRGRGFPVVIDPAWKPTATLVPVQLGPGPIGYSHGSQIVNVLQPCGRLALTYDPFADAWATKPSIPGSGNAGGVIPLPDGTALIAGGYNCNTFTGTTTSTVIFNPTTSLATPSGALPYAIGPVNGVVLPTGKVFAVDALGDSAVTIVWDPGTGNWSTSVNLGTPREYFTVSLLPGGDVLVAGGIIGGSPDQAAFVVDPVANTIVATPKMTGTRGGHTATTLANGDILMSGSDYAASGATLEIFHAATKAFIAVTQPMSVTRYGHTGTLLSDGTVLLAGGNAGSTTATTDIFTLNTTTPSASTIAVGPTLATPRNYHGAATIPGGRVLVFGGTNGPYTLTNDEIYTPDPIASTTGAGCPSTVAADGYCCDRACTGVCESCNQPGFQGICKPVVGPIPSGHAGTCGTFLCGGVASTGPNGCATSCIADSGCTAGNYCDLTSGQCVAVKPIASSCSANDQCGSGFCVDRFCCSTACNSKTCQACDVAGNLGACVDVASGDPHFSHSTCGSPAAYACVAGACATACTDNVDCASKYRCVGGSCVSALGPGSTCSANTDCQSDHCVDGVCCVTTLADPTCSLPCNACNNASTVGTCGPVASGAPHAPRSCAPYAACGAGNGLCATGCATSTDCLPGNACIGGLCVGKKANGGSCAAGTDCMSGNCADKVCCDIACNGACQACNLTGTVGTCSPANGIVDPHGICAAGTCADVCSAGACGFKPAGTVCGGTAPSCASGVVTASTCDGKSGPCGAAVATPCPNNLTCASASACNTSCVVDTDCRSGVCDPSTNQCVAFIDAGVVDTGTPDTGVPDTGTFDTAVADTFVPDTFVPDTYVPDTYLPDTTPAADTAVADTALPDVVDAREIAETPAPVLPAIPTVSGFTRCDKASDCPSGLFCTEGVCCNTPCTDTCHSCALLSHPGTCTLEPIGVDLKNECGPGLACLGTCGEGGQCIGSGTGTMCARNRCTDGSHGVGPAYCAAPAAPCSTDNVEAFDCGAYACVPAFGACETSCGASVDCAPGYVCDQTSKTCVAPTSSGGSGGCALDAQASRSNARAWLASLAMLAMAGAARARRRART
ncbi:MAG: Kelch repeat-containing protein [Polyangiales bacterium]